ncbi:thyroid receptor-interacting protein 11-like isoform X2 [Mya arenaria]|uniref:thyroid receptor-interacting protein 11-like isoform X2 n=1 Tax=Mya arenaria TaxID=6604 RepID=UPI0022E016C9|nr:thyroid receptor-interacting protein 11-like isoform X2 [Mya arenaria]
MSSWLGGSLSSLTGQLSNLTKDILTEGTEEVSDHVTELRVAQEKIKELDTISTGQKIEIDRLKLLVREQEEKAEASELQINRISTEYRALLQQKEADIKQLKQQNQELQSSTSFVTQQAGPAVLSLDSDNGFESIGYGGDEHDFGDQIALQHNVNRLRADVQRLQAECKHWKSLVKQQNNSAGGSNVSSDIGESTPGQDDSSVLKKIQELQDELAAEKDARQHELASLQDAHTHKMAQLRKKHKDELAQLNAKIQELDWGSEGWETQPSADDSGLKQKISALQKEVENLQEEKEEYLQQINSLAGDVEELNSELAVKQAQSLHMENQLKLCREEISQLKSEHDEVSAELYSTKHRLLDQLDANHKKAIEVGVASLEMEHSTLSQETSNIVENLGNNEHQKHTAGIVDSLEHENLVLKERNVGLQEQVTLLERALHNAAQDSMERDMQANTGSGVYSDDLDLNSDTASQTLEQPEMSKRIADLDEQVANLNEQVGSYKQEIQQFEMHQSDWLSEKEAMEELLGKMRSQLKEKENSLNLLEAQRGLLEVEKHDSPSKTSLPDLLESQAVDPFQVQSDESSADEKAFTALEEQIVTLEEAPIDDTEARSKEEDAEIAREVVELDRKVTLLTEANADLEQERDELADGQARLLEELDDLRSQLESQSPLREPPSPSRGPSYRERSTSVLNTLLKEKEDELQALIGEKEDLEKNLAEVPDLKEQLESLAAKAAENNKEQIESLEKEVDNLKRKLRGKNEEIVNLSLEKEEMMQSLEELDNQHQEAMEHIIQMKDKLSKTNEELKKKLTNSEQEKQALKTEIEKVKSQHLLNQADESSSSNELNHEIAELKDEMATLRAEIESLSNAKNRLDQQIAAKEEEIKGMKEKLTSSAQTLNDLHMDKQELQDKITKLKAEISKQAEKIKVMREENENTKRDNLDGKETESFQTSVQEIGVLEDENLKLKDDLEVLNTAMKQKSAEIGKLTDDVKRIQGTCDNLNSSIETKDKEIDTLQFKLKERELQTTEMNTKIATLADDCERLSKESSRKHDDCESFSRQLHALGTELSSLKKENKLKEEDAVHLCKQVESVNKELTLVKQNLIAKNAECDKLNADVKAIKDLLEETTDKLHTKCEECSELLLKNEEFKNKIEKITTEQEHQYDAKLLSATGELVLIKEELEHKTLECKELEEYKRKFEELSEEQEINYDAKLLSSTGELALVKEELESKDTELQRLDKEMFAKDEEIGELRSNIETLKNEVQHYKQELASMEQELLSDQTLQNKYEKEIEDLKSQWETLKLDNDGLNAVHASSNEKHAAIVQHYESLIHDMKAANNSNNSSLQLDYTELLQASHKKDLQITELQSKITDLFSQMQECQKETELAAEKSEKLEKECDYYKQEVSLLEHSLSKVETENSELSGSLHQNENMIAELSNIQDRLEVVETQKIALESGLREAKEKHDKVLTDYESELVKLNDTVQNLQSALAKSKSSENEADDKNSSLIEDINSLGMEVDTLKEEIKTLKDSIMDKERKIGELNKQTNEDHETISKLKEVCVEKNNQVTDLERKLNELSVPERFQGDGGNDAEIVAEKMVAEKIESVQKVQLLGTSVQNGDNDVDDDHAQHQRDVIAEIETLKGQLEKKDSVINELKRNNSSLLKMLDSKSKSSGQVNPIDILKLENEIKGLKMEKEQMMDVMNEKSRECSNLRSEVQRLMSVAGAQKTALDKMQKDTVELSQGSPKTDGARIDDMQKEVVQNLSRIIRDKDLEIESLTQKNQTLLSVLQESSTEGSQINSLMQDKDNLTKQLAALQNEREQMITYLNQKHQESLTYHAEVQRVTALLNSENEKSEKMRHDYEVLVPMFEDNKHALVKAQNEILNYKQKYQELEVKHGQLIHQDSCETIDKAQYDAKTQELNTLQERYNELMLTVKEKELKVQSVHQQVSDLEQNMRSTESERSAFKKQVDSFTFQIHGLQTEQGELKSEIKKLHEEKESVLLECQGLKEAYSRLGLQHRDREFEVQSLQEKVNSLTSIIQQQQGEKGQLDQVMVENAATQNQIRQLMSERDAAFTRVQQQQEVIAAGQREIQSLKEREAKLNRELNRLREHLLQIEDGYTQEALSAEKREKELRTRLASAEESALSSSSAVETASQHAIQQCDSLQQQLVFVSGQRDQAYVQLSTLQEQNDLLSSSISNLQMVLEEFQQDKERLVSEDTEKYRQQVASLTDQLSKAQADLRYTKEQLDEVSDGLEAASRLSEQLDRKEEALDALREEVQIRESALKSAEEELRQLRSRNDDKVDKLVIKNLFLGYFTTPQNRRHEVLLAIGGVLLFAQEDFEKIEGGGKGGWVPGFLKFGAGAHKTSPPTTPARRSTVTGPISRSADKSADSSFSQMFVKFLERESSPPAPTVRLPAEEMARDVQQKQKEATQKPAYNPFTAPRHATHSTPSSLATGSHGSSHDSHILISPAVSMAQTFPTFATPSQDSRTPPSSGRNTPASTSSSAILKDVLNR